MLLQASLPIPVFSGLVEIKSKKRKAQINGPGEPRKEETANVRPMLKRDAWMRTMHQTSRAAVQGGSSLRAL